MSSCTSGATPGRSAPPGAASGAPTCPSIRDARADSPIASQPPHGGNVSPARSGPRRWHVAPTSGACSYVVTDSCTISIPGSPSSTSGAGTVCPGARSPRPRLPSGRLTSRTPLRAAESRWRPWQRVRAISCATAQRRQGRAPCSSWDTPDGSRQQACCQGTCLAPRSGRRPFPTAVRCGCGSRRDAGDPLHASRRGSTLASACARPLRTRPCAPSGATGPPRAARAVSRADAPTRPCTARCAVAGRPADAS